MLINTYIARKYLQDLIQSILLLPTMYLLELHSLLCGSMDGKGVREKTDLGVYIWLSPFTGHLKLSQHCWLIGYTPIQKKNLLKINKEY